MNRFRIVIDIRIDVLYNLDEINFLGKKKLFIFFNSVNKRINELGDLLLFIVVNYCVFSYLFNIFIYFCLYLFFICNVR